MKLSKKSPVSPQVQALRNLEEAQLRAAHAQAKLAQAQRELVLAQEAHHAANRAVSYHEDQLRALDAH